MTACSSGQTVPDGPWADAIRDAQGRVTSEFQKEVFSDGVITREEYTEALDRYLSCMDDAGYTVALKPQGEYFTYVMNAALGIDAGDTLCRTGTVDEIELIYVDMLRDPLHRTGPEIFRDCLLAAGKIDPAITVAEVTEKFEAMIEGPTTLIDHDDPGVQECIWNPFGETFSS